MKKMYLQATLQKDYYRKAVILEDDYFIILKSYDTNVLAISKIDNSINRLWNGWSKTTNNHINDFLMLYGFNKVSKKEWLAMPCINNEKVYNIYMSNGFYTHKCPALLTENECEKEIDNILERRPGLCVWYD